MKIYLSTLFIILVILSGCDLVSQRSGDLRGLEIKTDKEKYSKKGNELITANILNTSSNAVFITTPGPVSLEKKIDGEWSNLGPWYFTIGIVPRLAEIAPGEKFSAIPGLYSNDYVFEETGSYRFNFHLYSSKFQMGGSVDGSEYALPLKHRISNTFYIVD